LLLDYVIAISGPVAVGKSVLADQFIERFKAYRLSTRQLLIDRGVENERGALIEAGQRLDRETDGAWVRDGVLPYLEREKESQVAKRRLVGAQSGNPSVRAGERASKRLDFSGVATGQARLLRVVEAVDALDRYEPFKRRVLGIDRPDAAAVALLRLFPNLIGFRKQAPGVEGDKVDIETRL
jgi:hypothetical protein